MLGRRASTLIGVIVFSLLGIALAGSVASAQAPNWFPMTNITGHTSVDDVDPDSAWTLYSIGTSATGNSKSWSLESGESKVLDAEPSGGHAIKASPNGLVAMVRQGQTGDYMVSVAYGSTGAIFVNFSMPSGALITGLAWINETTLLVGQASCNLTSFSVTGVPIRTYSVGGDGQCKFIEVSPDSHLFAAGTSGGTMKIWRISDAAVLFDASDSSRVFLDGVFAADLSAFVFIDSQRYVRWVDTSTFAEFRTVQIATSPQSISYLPAESLILIGDDYAPFLRAAYAGNGTIAWTDDRIAYKVSRVRAAPNGEWFVTASRALGAMSVWAMRANPWEPPPPPPEPVPVASIIMPVSNETYTNFLNVTGAVSPAGAARFVIVTIDNRTAFAATGTDAWSLPIDLRTLAAGYHEMAAQGIAIHTVGPAARVGFFTAVTGGTPGGPIELALGTPSNGSTIVQIGALAGTITNATNQTSVFVQIGGQSWLPATRTNLQWFATIHPAYNASGPVTIGVAAFDSDGRTAWAGFSVNITTGAPQVPSPEVFFREPTAGAVVDGEFVVSGATVNGTGPVLTRVSMNGSQQATSVFDREWSITFTADGAAPGTHFLWVEAIDSDGRVAFAGRPMVVRHTVGNAEILLLFPTNGTEVDHSLVLVGVCSNCTAANRIQVFVGAAMVADLEAYQYWQANLTDLGGFDTVIRVELWNGQTLVDREERHVQPRSEAASTQRADSSPFIIVALVVTAAAVVALAMRASRQRSSTAGDSHENDPAPAAELRRVRSEPRSPKSRGRSPRRGR